MSAMVSPHERATAILSIGIVAAVIVISFVALASAVVVIGKGGVAAYESLVGALAHTSAQSTTTLR